MGGYASSGSTYTESTYGGGVSLERYRFLMRQPNYGRGLLFIGNTLGAGFRVRRHHLHERSAGRLRRQRLHEVFMPSEDCQKPQFARDPKLPAR